MGGLLNAQTAASVRISTHTLERGLHIGYNVMVNDYIVLVGRQTNYRESDCLKLNITICTAENNLQTFVYD